MFGFCDRIANLRPLEETESDLHQQAHTMIALLYPILRPTFSPSFVDSSRNSSLVTGGACKNQVKIAAWISLKPQLPKSVIKTAHR